MICIYDYSCVTVQPDEWLSVYRNHLQHQHLSGTVRSLHVLLCHKAAAEAF